MGEIISSNGFPLLQDAGAISHAKMEQLTNQRYIEFDQRRKAEEAIAADLADEAELKTLENKLKHRPLR